MSGYITSHGNSNIKLTSGNYMHACVQCEHYTTFTSFYRCTSTADVYLRAHNRLFPDPLHDSSDPDTSPAAPVGSDGGGQVNGKSASHVTDQLTAAVRASLRPRATRGPPAAPAAAAADRGTRPAGRPTCREWHRRRAKAQFTERGGGQRGGETGGGPGRVDWGEARAATIRGQEELGSAARNITG